MNIKEVPLMLRQLNRKNMQVLLLFICIFILSFSYHCMANDNISVIINGEELVMDQQPILENGRTLLPMRAIFESFNADVSWNDATSSVIGKTKDVEVHLTLGSKIALVNGKDLTLDVEPKLVNDRMVVPARFVAESLGAKVEWDDESWTVIISTSKNNAEPEQDVVNEKNNLKEYLALASDKLKAGPDFIALVKPDGGLWMWGNNEYGQISDELAEHVHSPVKVMDNVRTIALGNKHTVILLNTGEVYALGDNSKGQTTSKGDTAILDSISSIASGNEHSIALSESGILYGWGSNKVNQLGVSDKAIIEEPVVIDENIKKIYAFKNFTVALSNDNELTFYGDVSGFKYLSGKKLFSMFSSSITSPTNLTMRKMQGVTDVEVWKDAIIVNNNGELKGFFTGSNVTVRNENLEEVCNREWSLEGVATLKKGIIYASSQSNDASARLSFPGAGKGEKGIIDDVSYAIHLECGTVVAMLKDSSVWVWGSDARGCLGDGYYDNGENVVKLFEPLCIDGITTESPIANMEIKQVTAYGGSCDVIVEFTDKDGNIICPMGIIEAKVFDNKYGDNVIRGSSKYLLNESNYKGKNQATLNVKHIGKTHAGKGRVQLIYMDVGTKLVSESGVVSGFPLGGENPSGSTGSNSSSGNPATGVSGSGNAGENPMYKYYDNIINRLITERMNVPYVRMYTGGRWQMVPNQVEINRINDEIEYYTALRDSCK